MNPESTISLETTISRNAFGIWAAWWILQRRHSGFCQEPSPEWPLPCVCPQQKSLLWIHPLETCPGYHSTTLSELLEHFWSVPLAFILTVFSLVSGLNCTICVSGSLCWISAWSPLRDTISVFSPHSFPEVLSSRYQIATQFLHEHGSKIRGRVASVGKHNRSSAWDLLSNCLIHN